MDPIQMNAGYEISEGDKFGKSLYNPITDRVTPERIEDPFFSSIAAVGEYLDFTGITTPTNPDTGKGRVYYRTTGSDTKLFVLDSASTEKELASTSYATLDIAYNNGSTIAVDSTDLVITLTSPRLFQLTDGADNVLTVNTTGVTIGEYTLPLADGAANEFLVTDGAGNISFSSSVPVSFLGVAAYTKSTAIIASGEITVTTSYVQVDTEGSASSDDLDTINGGIEGSIVILENTDSLREVVVKAGTGNIDMSGDYILLYPREKLMLIYNGSQWNEISPGVPRW